MIPANFEYHAPDSVAEVVSLLGQFGDEAKVLAGGHSLLPMMKQRFAEPAHLIDLNRIPDLRGIREEKGIIHIGAMTTEADLINSPLLQEKCPILPDAAHNISDPQVRNRGTIGGDVVHGDPGNDHPALMLATEASFVLLGPMGERTLPADGFFLGTYWNQLEANEILKEILIPAFAPKTGYAYCKFKRKQGDWATAATAVVLELDGEKCAKINIAVTNVAPMALKAKDAENLLTGKIIDDSLIDEAANAVMAICDPAEDLRGSVEYKTHIAGEMTRRAIRLALQRSKR